jgi:DNA-binding NarL/FixJ family response regulator
MRTAAAPCRAYIVYTHRLFAQGVRSMLHAGHDVEIVGMARRGAKALQAVNTLRPQVLVVEESWGAAQPWRLETLLQAASAGRVVTLSLDSAFATVYERRRLMATGRAQLVAAIRGAGPRTPSPVPGVGASRA